MKYLFSIVSTILFFTVLPVFSQDSGKWLRIEFEDKKLSVAVPQTNIIDTEKRDLSQRLGIVAFENGVEFEVFHRKPHFIPGFLSSINPSVKTKSDTFQVGDFTVLTFAPVTLNGKVERSMTFIKDKNYFTLTVRSKTGEEKEVNRFFLSIKLEGKPLFTKNEKTNFQEETVSASDLKTSPEIIEAEKRPTGKFEGKIRYELKSDEEITETEDLTHHAIIIDKPFPRYDPKTGFTGAGEVLDVRLKVQFRADGQIGDIVVLSNSDEDFTQSAISKARRIKFVPARRNNEFVDSYQIVRYSMISVPNPNITIR